MLTKNIYCLIKLIVIVIFVTGLVFYLVKSIRKEI